MPVPMDSLGIDVLLTGSQKALALPPGFSLFSVSEKGFARAAEVADRGYYFDFLEFKKQQEADMTPTTPSVGHIHALASQLEVIFAEGLENRYARHQRTNALVHEWVRARGFRVLCAGRCALRHAHVREKQPRDRRRRPNEKTSGDNIIS